MRLFSLTAHRNQDLRLTSISRSWTSGPVLHCPSRYCHRSRVAGHSLARLEEVSLVMVAHGQHRGPHMCVDLQSAGRICELT